MKNDYIGTIYCGELDTEIKSFLSAEKLKILRENSVARKILQGMEYRPDKIAAYYLGDETAGWAVSAANNFENGISDYYEGRSILVPTSEAFTLLSEEAE